MAINIGATEAMQVLRDQFGQKLEAGSAEGRQMMADALADHFNISKDEARRLIDGLEQAHSIRWVEGQVGPALRPTPPTVSGGTLNTTGPTQTPEGLDTGGGGYWQLSSEPL